MRDGQNPAYRPSGTPSPLPLMGRGRGGVIVDRTKTLVTPAQPSPIEGEGSQMARRHPKPQEVMPKQKRSDDWGFPRWRSYGDKGRHAARLRLCDREGCNEIGDRPAPKAPNSPERWYFCEAHAGEYNRNWNYFAGLSPEEAARRAAEEEQGNSGFRQSAQWKWAGPGDGSRSRDEMRALDALELESDADFKAVKAAHRRLVKETHPDANPGDELAAKKFKQVQAAYDVLKKAEERRLQLGADNSDD
jgi:hypothetical protein